MTAKIFGLSPFRVIIMYLKHLLNLTSQESIISYLISFNKINKNFVSKESTRKDVQIFLKRFKKFMSKIFSVGLLGLGRVGARDDFVRKKFCRTHLLTILKNNNLKLKFIIEPDEKNN